MLKKLFGLLAGAKTGLTMSAVAAQPASPASAASAALMPDDIFMRAIAERAKTDPLVGAKLGGKEIFERLVRGMKTDRGVHAESLLCALGALAGYACQASLRANALTKGLPETTYLTLVTTRNGQKFWFGDALNKPLAESQYAVWKVVAGAAQQAGCTAPPALDDIFRHTAQVVGSPEFGVPRLPDGHPTQDLPATYVRSLWPVFLPVVKKFCPVPDQWPLLYAIAIQQAIAAAKATLDPCAALSIVMESAVPMSKIDLAAA
jgi:hypothetical protein